MSDKERYLIRSRHDLRYSIYTTPLGRLLIVWYSSQSKIKLIRIYLPATEKKISSILRRYFPCVKEDSQDDLSFLGQQLINYFNGRLKEFSLDIELDLTSYTAYQRKVFNAVKVIPYGNISTYSDIAENIGSPKSARAIGQTMAINPFPIIIPCHRIIKFDKSLGGFAGGLEMKRRLLELEGITFNKHNKVD